MLVFIINAFCKKGKHFSKISGKGRGRRQSTGFSGWLHGISFENILEWLIYCKCFFSFMAHKDHYAGGVAVFVVWFEMFMSSICLSFPYFYLF